ncbi:cell division protein FtsZ [Mycoplasmopsis lipofaciens]|uniref:cell division protein FtsZ n=1 Tax=Mycoplasmopsis lipofaciens TaxID=114884 RepID=UPI0004875E33|nr:cell division protein FtsZ [Mycoplasmopsis lipofaciens]
MEHESKRLKLKVIGIGGAGNNAINLLLNENLSDISLYIANTDSQDLDKSICENKILLGKNNNGMGAGGNPEIGAKCASESEQDIYESIKDADIVIIAAGLGGGTGTGAAPVIANIAKKANKLTLAIVTTPFAIEGDIRANVANEGFKKLKTVVDSYVLVSNQKISDSYNKLPVSEMFKFSNTVLKNMIKIIKEIVFETGAINLDFNDLREVLVNGQDTIIGLGRAVGKERYKKAVENALAPLMLDENTRKCEKILIHIICDKNTNFDEIEQAKKIIDGKLKNEENKAQTFFGLRYSETTEKEELFQVNIIATGLKDCLLDNNDDNSFSNMSTNINTVNTSKNNNETNESSKDQIPNFFS